MLTLRLTQTTEGQDRYRVEVALKGDSFPLRTASAEFEFKLTDQQQERVRWYLEDYLQYPHDPAPTIAEGIEREMQDIGTRLFGAACPLCRLWAPCHRLLAHKRLAGSHE